MNKYSTKNIIKTILSYGIWPKKLIITICIVVLINSSIMALRPSFVSKLTDEGLATRNFKAIIFWCFILIFSMLISNINELIQIKILTSVSNIFSQRLFQVALDKIMKAPYSFINQRNSTELFSTISGDINRIIMLTDRTGLMIVRLFFQIVGGTIGIFVLEWRVALLIMLVIPLKQLLIIGLSKRKGRLTKEYINEWKDFSEWFGDQTNGVLEIKLWNLYDKKIKEFKAKYRKITDLNVHMELCDGIENTVNEIVGLMLEALVYIICGYLLCRNQMSIGNVFAFLSYVTYISTPLSFFTNIPYIWAQIKPAAIRYLEIIDWPSEYLENITDKNIDIGKNITAKNISYSYPSGKVILKNLDLTIKAGEKIAIIGENGSGKTTLINIILGILQPTEGDVYLGNKTINQIGLNKWRENFALVGQFPHLFQGSLKSNIDLYDTLSVRDIERIDKQYGFNVYSKMVSDGTSYKVMDNGINLSGGEIQKIAFLRAMVKNADIIIFDEAFSNCDEISRKLVRKEILSSKIKKTVILVSHYREDIKDVNKVYELKGGRLKEIKKENSILKI